MKYKPTSYDPSDLKINVNSNVFTNDNTTGTTPVYSDDLQLVQDNKIVNQPTKEGFFNTGIESVSVNSMGNLEGPSIYTNGQMAHGLTYDKAVEGIKKGEHVTDRSVAGAGKGDNFEEIYQNYVKIQDEHDLSPTGVRSAEEIDEITKSLNGNTNLATHNMLTRAGAGKTKIVLDKNGTVGVMDDNARRVPERERNHKIYATGHVIPIQGYSLDYTDMYQNISNSGSGIAEAMAHSVNDRIVGFGEGAVANSQEMTNKAENSFSDTY